MGVKNGPAMFQRMIAWVLRDLSQVMVYIDDVLVGTPEPRPIPVASCSVGDIPLSAEHQPVSCRLGDIPFSAEHQHFSEFSDSFCSPRPIMALQAFKPVVCSVDSDILDLHFHHVFGVLSAFKKHRLFVKGSKMHLFMIIIKFCGHILSGGQRRAAPSKLEAIRKWTPEVMTRVTHLKAFLGLAQYYAIYMKDFAKIAVPLSKQLKNRDVENTKVVWDQEMRDSLQRVKDLLLQNVVLDIPHPYKPYVLEVDSSCCRRITPCCLFSRRLQGDNGKGQVKWRIRASGPSQQSPMVLSWQSR